MYECVHRVSCDRCGETQEFRCSDNVSNSVEALGFAATGGWRTAAGPMDEGGIAFCAACVRAAPVLVAKCFDVFPSDSCESGPRGGDPE